MLRPGPAVLPLTGRTGTASSWHSLERPSLPSLLLEDLVEQRHSYKPTAAFVGASWAALFVGVLAYLVGLWNAPQMLRNEKGYYLAMLLLGLFSAVSLQKA